MALCAAALALALAVHLFAFAITMESMPNAFGKLLKVMHISASAVRVGGCGCGCVTPRQTVPVHWTLN